MSFTPPTDNSKVILAGIAGVSLAVITFLATADRTPHVGDNIHHLPHGGTYQDGNKQILFLGPRPAGTESISHKLWAAAGILLLSVAVLLSELCGRRRRPTCRCSNIPQ